MAKVQNTLIGRSSGSVGGATFTTWKGINVLKSKAVSVANPRTPAQLLQRAKLSLMVAIYRLISEPIQIGFNPQANGKSEYNAFMGANINNATSGTSESNVAFVPANALMSKGSIGSTGITSASMTNQVTVGVVHPTNTPVGGSADDIANVVVYNATQDNWGITTGSSTRSDTTASGFLPTQPASGDVIHAWLFFKSANSNDVNDSDYITFTV